MKFVRLLHRKKRWSRWFAQKNPPPLERRWLLEAGRSRETQSLETEEKARVKEDVQGPGTIIICYVSVAGKPIIWSRIVGNWRIKKRGTVQTSPRIN
jgi:hypothetical protein